MFDSWERMPRSSQVAEEISGGGNCKIRKREFPPSSSTSSSSSVLRTCRLKRAVFIGRRGGLSTPFPEWKMDSGSPTSTVGVSEFSQQPPSSSAVKERQGPVSARKLANALRELVAMPSPMVRGQMRQKRSSRGEARAREKISNSIHSGSLPPHLSDPSHSPISEVMDRSCSGLHRKPIQWKNSTKARANEHNVDFLGYKGLMELGGHSRGYTATSPSREIKGCLKDLKKGLNSSKEFLKMVNHFCGFEEHHHHSYIASVFSAVCAELERASVLVDQLVKEQRQDRSNIAPLNKRHMDGNVGWKRREQERFQEGFQVIVEELKIEKKLRRRMERQNEKLGMELAETRAALSRSRHALENEKKSREVIEHVCNELVHGIGEDKAEMEEMKQEYVKVREELEREREMLQLADTWREERVHMKLTEAKFQLEEKNAAVDQLRNELETFLSKKKWGGDCISHGYDLGAESDAQWLVHCGKGFKSSEKVIDDGEVHNKIDDDEDDDDEVDSMDSDLHSIELNMDNNSQSYRWSFTKGKVLQDTKAPGIENANEGGVSEFEALTRNGFSATQRNDLLINSKDPTDVVGSLEFENPVNT